jgi:transposase
MIARTVVAFEAGRNGFGLTRWLRARGIEAHVIHPTSVIVSREHRRAKTTGSIPSCSSGRFSVGCVASMTAIPTLAEEDAERPNRERESLVGERSRIAQSVRAA